MTSGVRIDERKLAAIIEEFLRRSDVPVDPDSGKFSLYICDEMVDVLHLAQYIVDELA